MELDAVNISNLQGVIESFGGKLINPNGTDMQSVCAFNTTASQNAFVEFYNKFYSSSAELVDPSDTNQSLFKKKSAGMALIVRPTVAELSTVSNLSYDFLPNPFVTAGVGCGGYAITKKAADTSFNNKKISEYAWDLLKYLVSTEGQNLLSETGLVVPCIESLSESGTWTSYNSSTLNHLAFTTGYTGTTVSLNDINVFAPASIAEAETEIQSIVTFITSYSGSSFATDISTQLSTVYGRMSALTLAS